MLSLPAISQHNPNKCTVRHQLMTAPIAKFNNGYARAAFPGSLSQLEVIRLYVRG